MKFFFNRFKSVIYNLFNKYIIGNNGYFSIVLSLLITFFFIRIFEIVYIQSVFYVNYNPEIIVLAFLNDLLLVSAVSLLLYLPYLMTKKNKIAKGIIISLFIFIAFVLHSLVLYFSITLIPLDHVLLQYSVSDTKIIFSEFGKLNLIYLTVFFPIISIIALIKVFKAITSKYANIVLIGLFLPILLNNFSINYKSNNEYSYNDIILSSNKLTYLYTNIINFLNKKDYFDNTLDNESIIKSYQEIYEKNYLNTEYPLSYVSNSKSTLTHFFNLTKEKPNIVFIIVESLSSVYSGKNSNSLSFSPFLDSLSEHSIVFHNFLANGQRTFCALPNIIGSLPYGERGFTEFGQNMPEHDSWLKLLIKNGYEAAFFYGGWANLSNMDIFMRRQGVKKIYEKKEYSYKDTKLRLSVDSIPYGIDDKALFKWGLSELNTSLSHLPYVHVYLTLSMHFPFTIPDKEFYIEKAKNHIKNNNVKNPQKYLKHKDAFSTFLFTDDALRNFFNEYKKRPEYNNTIFFIVGDHMVGEILHNNEIDRYRVPLIIYSPLLNQQKDIYAVNTHLDIAPSIISFFRENYQISTPNSFHWLGDEFDTLGSFRNNRVCAFMMNNRNVHDFLYKDYYISKENIYKLNNGLNISRLNNPDLFQDILNKMEIDKWMNNYVFKNNLIKKNNNKNSLVLVNNNSINPVVFNLNHEFSRLLFYNFHEDFEFIDINVEFSIPNYDSLKSNIDIPIILSITNVDDVDRIYWQQFLLSDFATSTTNNVVKFYLKTVLYSDKFYKIKKGDELKLYFWDKDKSNEILEYEINNILLIGDPISNISQ